jgi:hypothetical protein
MSTQTTVAPELLLTATTVGMSSPSGVSMLWKAHRPEDPGVSCLLLVSKVTCDPEHRVAFNAECNAATPLSLHDLVAMIP